MARERKRPMRPEQAIRRATTRRARPAGGTSAEQVRALERRLGRERARQKLGVSERTMRRYRAGGTPSKANAEKIQRAASISPLREARLRNRGAYVRMTAKIGGGTSGAKRKNARQRTIGDEGMASIHLSGDEMAEILDAFEAGDDEGALEALREAMADDYGFPHFDFEDVTRLEFLRDDPNA
jgi:hypothetical protein